MGLKSDNPNKPGSTGILLADEFQAQSRPGVRFHKACQVITL